MKYEFKEKNQLSDKKVKQFISQSSYQQIKIKILNPISLIPITSTNPYSHMEYTYSTPVKEQQNISKVSKSQNQTRDGDWICLNCNNLNFSFRKKCNRCKTQTRKQNEELQNAYTLYFLNQQEANMYNYHQHESMYYVKAEGKHEAERKGSMNDLNQHPLAFSRNNQKSHTAEGIEITVTSPSKELVNENSHTKIGEKINQKLRTPSSKKKRTLKKNKDMLPSVSPLLKKLLAKEDTNSKPNQSQGKDPLNVALFYDEVWDTNKQNLPIEDSQLSNSKKTHLYFTNSPKKLTNSRMHKTSESMSFNPLEEDGFGFLMRSPEKDYDEDEIIEIDEGDEELAQIISKIIV